MNLILIGAITMANFVASLFFLRFWDKTRDRFFLFFAIAFSVEASGRLIMGLSDETQPCFYLIRLLAYSLILLAIIDKNWKRKQEPKKER
jgi:hypothetical protein